MPKEESLQTAIRLVKLAAEMVEITSGGRGTIQTGQISDDIATLTSKETAGEVMDKIRGLKSMSKLSEGSRLAAQRGGLNESEQQKMRSLKLDTFKNIAQFIVDEVFSANDDLGSIDDYEGLSAAMMNAKGIEKFLSTASEATKKPASGVSPRVERKFVPAQDLGRGPASDA